MTIYLGADHRGFELKEKLKEWLKDHGYTVEDFGAHKLEPEDDYPDYAIAVARKVAGCTQKNEGNLFRLRPERESKEACRGILLCGSGHGMDMIANKHKGIRAALAFNAAVAKQSREHEDANVLVLAADWLAPDETGEIVKTFLETPFSDEGRHVRRIGKIKSMENP